MKTVFADVKLRVLGELRASTIGDEWYNVSVNYRRGEGPSACVCVCQREREGVIFFFLNTVFTYKEPRTPARYSAHSKVCFPPIALKSGEEKYKLGEGVCVCGGDKERGRLRARFPTPPA